METQENFNMIESEKKISKKKVLVAISLTSIAIVITLILVFFFNSSFYIYGRAETFLSEKNYIKAIEYFRKLDDYKDSEEKCKEAYYGAAKQFLLKEDFQKASKYFEKADGDQLETYKNYIKAIISLKNGEENNAIDILSKLGDFENSKSFLNEAYYKKADKFYKEANYSNAKENFLKANDYKDAKNKATLCDFLVAELKYKEGELNIAKDYYLSLPADFSHDGIKVADRLDILKKYSKAVKLCGTWKGKNGKLSVRQTHKSTGLWDQWDSEYTDTLTLKCIINGDGTVTYKGEANYWVYTNYSSLSSLLNVYNFTKSFTVTGKSLPKKLVNEKNLKITYDNSKIILNYDYNDKNYSMDFNYRYKSSITYRK